MLSPLETWKSLSNLAGEWVLLCPAIMLAAVVRVWLGNHSRKRLISMLCLALLVLVAVAVFALTPPLPE
jgi:hypothetical protein